MIRGLFNRSIIIHDIFSCIEISHHSVPDSVDDIIWTHCYVRIRPDPDVPRERCKRSSPADSY